MSLAPEEPKPRFGRMAAEDPRDRQYPMRAAIRKAPTHTWRYWYPPPTTLDQGYTSSCVGHAWRHFLDCSPTRTHGMGASAMDIYRRAQTVDEWPGEDYEGTSVRAGLKVLESDGHIEQYLWAWNVNDVADWLLTRGPVVLGTTWYEGMFYPQDNEVVKLDGSPVGGHAYLCLGVNTRTGLFTCLNSWGPEWGKNGRFRLTTADLQTLLNDRGEAAVATEQPLIQPQQD